MGVCLEFIAMTVLWYTCQRKCFLMLVLEDKYWSF